MSAVYAISEARRAHVGENASFDAASDPSPQWARQHPDDLLRFLFVSPRPCEAVDELLGLSGGR